MVIKKYLVPAFAAFGLVAGQSSLCSQATVKINSQADATALASCSTVSGSIEIASTVTDSISLDGIRQIKGDLKCVDAVKIISLSGKDLASIGGAMNLTSLTILSNLAFPQLTSVQSIQWAHLNALQELGFGAGISNASSIIITDTELNSLDGINLSTAESIDINNNPYLQAINSQISSITKSLNIDSNSQNLKVEFPNLIFSFNMTLRNILSIKFPSLASVNATLGFYSNDMTSIFAPKLTTVGGELAFIANPSMVNISMPMLTTIGGGFTITNNSALLTIDGFTSLKTTGAITLSGEFTSAALPSLTDCRGTFELDSSGNASCSTFDAYSKSKVIKGEYECKTAGSAVSSGSSTSTSTTSSPSSSSTKDAASVYTVNTPATITFSALVGAFLQMIL